jgi:DNA-binding response OmpR family regulator
MSQAQNILIVDDEPGITNLVKSILNSEGFGVEQANSQDEVDERLNQQAFDLVILDLMMPGVSGWDVYSKVRAHEAHRDVPVIILSARIREKEIQDALQVRRVHDYITKPFSVEDFISRVKRAIAEKA